ncbi:2-amino-4-hydroxy-6-hydroxymethyldihydropteridine diphosphokinase [Flavobacteriaceae bacterium]|jgi:2-amino-4-hydroxy-6-hydroxymethyldihydropteridine diphosphokinase|nr:2-amino-4-hydroxy-6-hydroxymethyldihydropteridine diphosphokinase [Flavobacteriaceae bacterium]MDC1371568.1 2-amino-4-hydroxy-6-hydroxymethyldihydropteridine diphosphokinase [Flavobacteriaceae bacterium]
MKSFNKYHISIGSNIGDRLQNLQNAIDLIHLEISIISSISPIYKTKAVGFNGDDFYNICISFFSNDDPNNLLQSLLNIEGKLGRTRNNKNVYESRTIDLDIILIEDQIINNNLLTVPHPSMHLREFVLAPLNDIDPNINHPILNKNSNELLKSCESGDVEKLREILTNPKDQFDISKFKYIAIEGNIGAGKTSLAKKISIDFNSKLILERFADNPFLPKFYEDPDRYAFTLEMSFLAERYQQITDDLSQLNIFNDSIVSDYDIFKSLIFSKITLSEDEFALYRKLFFSMYKDILKPDLYIYLNQNIDRLKENIKKRGRDYEQNIDSKYLKSINSGYLDFHKTQTDLNIKIIDINNMDFVNNRIDYLSILKSICQ